MCLMMLCTTSNCFAGLHDYPTIAVMPYANRAAVSSQIQLSDAGLVSEFVIEELLDTGRFDVVEREEIAAVAREQKLSLTGLFDASTAVQMGGLVGAKYLVIGSVTGLSTKTSGLSYNNSSLGKVAGTQNTVIANVTARIIDVETGRIVLAAHGTGESASANAEFVLRKTWVEETDDNTRSMGYDYSNTDMEALMMNDDSMVMNEDYGAGTSETGGFAEYGTVTDSSNYDYDAYTTASHNYGCGANSSNKVPHSVIHKIVIGSTEFSQVQVRNSLYKAVIDLVSGPYGIMAKMDGKAKKAKI